MPTGMRFLRSPIFFLAVLSACETKSEHLGEVEEKTVETDLILDGEAHRVALEETEDGFLLEGDMIVTDLLIPELTTPSDETSLESISVTPQHLLWPSGVVYYTVAASLPDKGRVYTAMERWSVNTPIRFVPRTNQRDFVTFRPASGCSAHIGRVGGQQFVNLASYCNLGLIIHEVGHTFGLFHEHTRSDRDSYVRVLWSNIPDGLQSQYWKNGAATERGPYDLASIMHYGSYEFTRNGFATLLRRSDDGYIRHPNEKYAPSAGDSAAIRSLYRAVTCPFGDGLYCGRNGIGGKRGSLYQCTAGQLSLVDACSAGCFEAPPGEPDRCNVECAFGDGFYCGKNGVSGRRNTLYECRGGVRSKVRECAAGCVARSPGQNDSCAN